MKDNLLNNSSSGGGNRLQQNKTSLDNHSLDNQNTHQSDAKTPAQLQAKGTGTIANTVKANPVNNTGLPDNIKAGVEKLSGYSMDDVKVHYNSSKPAQLKAHAYAQGTDIHVAPGQEQHVAHEAWHVVQQKQGRVQSTTQLKEQGTNINNDQSLEREADVMGARAASHTGNDHTHTSNLSYQSDSISNAIIQRKPKIGEKFKLTKAIEEKNLNVGDVVILKAEQFGQFRVELTDGKTTWIKGFVTDYAPADTNEAIDSVSQSAEVSTSKEKEKKKASTEKKAAVKKLTPQKKKEVVENAIYALPQKPKRKIKKPKKIHKTVAQGAKQMIINYVMLGDNELKPQEKFNIYSWRSLGHIVNIYTHPFLKPPQTLATLGLEKGDANIIPLATLLGADDKVNKENSPQVALTDARALLKSWIAAIPKDKKPSKDHIYNMVDLTKSYIGGSQRGIVLDLKVGPSLHLQDYEDTMYTHRISYSRGTNTAANKPENQSMGTMQESDDLRLQYAETFNKEIKDLKERNDKEPNHDGSWFNAITGKHGTAHQSKGKFIDTATQLPDGNLKDKSKDYDVSEPGGWGHGPFRVFKKPGDQSNKAGGGTTDREIYMLMKDVLDQEIGWIENDNGYGKAAALAVEEMKKQAGQIANPMGQRKPGLPDEQEQVAQAPLAAEAPAFAPAPAVDKAVAAKAEQGLHLHVDAPKGGNDKQWFPHPTEPMGWLQARDQGKVAAVQREIKTIKALAQLGIPVARIVNNPPPARITTGAGKKEVYAEGGVWLQQIDAVATRKPKILGHPIVGGEKVSKLVKTLNAKVENKGNLIDNLERLIPMMDTLCKYAGEVDLSFTAEGNVFVLDVAPADGGQIVSQEDGAVDTIKKGLNDLIAALRA